MVEVGKLEFVDKDLYKVLDNSGKGLPRVELDDTDHIYFKCKECGHELVITHIEAESWKESDRQFRTVIRFYLLCPECGTPYYMKAYQPKEYGKTTFGDPELKENTKNLFLQGIKKGWIKRTWEEIIDIVHSAKYSKSALEYVGLTREKFEQFKELEDHEEREENGRHNYKKDQRS